MEKNKHFQAVPINAGQMGIFTAPNRRLIAIIQVEPLGMFMENAELTSGVIEAYEEYYKTLSKRMNR
ncbi:MAG: hypothetical protein RSF33_07875 [Hydrogenoanaerobacterium sp.]